MPRDIIEYRDECNERLSRMASEILDLRSSLYRIRRLASIESEQVTLPVSITMARRLDEIRTDATATLGKARR